MVNATFQHQMVLQGMSMNNLATICQGADVVYGQRFQVQSSFFETPIFVVTYFVPIFHFKNSGKNN
jgi:hypothetical protein